MAQVPFQAQDALFEVVELLAGASHRLARSTVKRLTRRPRPYGCTLRPGLDTPLWNALAAAIRPHLRKRGEKAQLARLLLLHRQRVHEYFVHGTAMPDAERALRLIQWLAARRAGRRPG